MKKFSILLLLAFGVACGPKGKAGYTPEEEQRIQARIIAHIFSAPPYVKMKDRLSPDYQTYYLEQVPNFKLNRLEKNEEGTHFFLIERPASGEGQRAVGGTFRWEGSEAIDFNEVFVTPILPVDDLKKRSEFLFEQLIRGKINEYLVMASYVQWPNEASYYDTVTFEWKLKPEFVLTDSVSNR